MGANLLACSSECAADSKHRLFLTWSGLSTHSCSRKTWYLQITLQKSSLYEFRLFWDNSLRLQNLWDTLVRLGLSPHFQVSSRCASTQCCEELAISGSVECIPCTGVLGSWCYLRLPPCFSQVWAWALPCVRRSLLLKLLLGSRHNPWAGARSRFLCWTTPFGAPCIPWAPSHRLGFIA